MMQVALWIYVFLMLFLGIKSYFNIKNYKDFAIAGAKGTTSSITFSLLASMIGSSATFGMVALAQKHGFPAFWWLGTGAFFLVLQALILSKPVRNLNAYSLPDVAKIVISKKASIYISLIIVMAWIGIIAAQFIALGQIVNIMIDSEYSKIIIAIIAILITFYAFLGGQLSILRTDSYQFIFLFSAVTLTFLLLYGTQYYDALFMQTIEQSTHIIATNNSINPEMLNARNFIIPEPNFSITNLDYISFNKILEKLAKNFALFNDSFHPSDLFYLALVAGLSFFVGPDIFTRNFAAKNAQTAQKATFISAFILLLFSFLLTYIALWVHDMTEAQNIITTAHALQGTQEGINIAQSVSMQNNLLVNLIKNYIPTPLAILLAIGLISALISSADTCLMSTAVILSHDIFKNNDIKQTRFFILLIGAIALTIALYKADIISILISAYSVYVPGVVFPLAFSIYFYKKYTLNPQLLFLAIVSGSLLGLLSTLFKIPSLAIFGIITSALLSLVSYLCKKNISIAQKA